MKPRGEQPCGSRNAKAGALPEPPTRSWARSGTFAARPIRPNRPSAASSSTTASWCRGCATAPRSRPARSTRSAPICRSTAPRSRRRKTSRSRPRPSMARRSRPISRRLVSASSTTGKNICCSSRPAAKRPRSPTGFCSSWATCSLRRPRFGCSMPASAMAPCCRGSCARCTRGFRPCRSTSSPRRYLSKTSA